MKRTLTILMTALTLHAFGGADHTHEKREPGPNGGRVLQNVDPHAEFFVTPDRHVRITFLGDDGKAIPVKEQIVKVTVGKRSEPIEMTFVKSGEVLVSEQVVPEGTRLPVVVQVRAAPGAGEVVERFYLDFSICPGCQLPEYACICGH